MLLAWDKWIRELKWLSVDVDTLVPPGGSLSSAAKDRG